MGDNNCGVLSALAEQKTTWQLFLHQEVLLASGIQSACNRDIDGRWGKKLTSPSVIHFDPLINGFLGSNFGKKKKIWIFIVVVGVL